MLKRCTFAISSPGGLPTFVDVGASFGAPALREDNLVRQLAVHGRRLAVLGDDTWMQLFPDAATFAMAHPFPSFDVQDLYTVDDGVKRHMTELLQRPGACTLYRAAAKRTLTPRHRVQQMSGMSLWHTSWVSTTLGTRSAWTATPWPPSWQRWIRHEQNDAVVAFALTH